MRTILHEMKSAVTLLELLVVVVIMGILASVAVTVYTGHVDRARVAACKDTIRQLELAINQYEVDTGQLPPSSSGLPIAPDQLIYEGNAFTGSFGSGYLQLALIHSLSGNFHQPLSYRWLGPYIQPDEDQLGDRNGLPVTLSTPKGYVQLLDPWGLPYYYLRSDHYPTMGGTQYPNTHPFYASETYYNPSSFQIFSKGRNGSTYPVPYRGEETDDVNNWRKYGLPYVVASGGARSHRPSPRTTGPSSSSPSGSRPRTQTPGQEDLEQLVVPLTFSLGDTSHVLFSWPRGWSRYQNKVINASEKEERPIWLFQSTSNLTYEELIAPYKTQAGVEIIFEGPDPSVTVPDAYVLEARSQATPELEIQEDAKEKPYHLVFAFKMGEYTCWWAANFYSVESMEQGRLFITAIVRTKTPLTKEIR